MEVWAADERVRLARSQAVRRRRSARALVERSHRGRKISRVDQTEIILQFTFLVFTLKLLDEVIDETVIKVLTTQMSVTSSSLDLENTLLDSQKRDIESSSTQIEDEDIALARDLLVKTVGDGRSGGLVDDTKDIKATDDTSILGGLPLRVVEVCRDCDYGIVDSGTKVRFSGFLHLGQHHCGNFFGGLEKKVSALWSDDA